MPEKYLKYGVVNTFFPRTGKRPAAAKPTGQKTAQRLFLPAAELVAQSKEIVGHVRDKPAACCAVLIVLGVFCAAAQQRISCCVPWFIFTIITMFGIESLSLRKDRTTYKKK